MWLCWKIAGTTFQCMVVLQYWGQDPQKSENYGTSLSPTFNKNQDLVPWNGEE